MCLGGLIASCTSDESGDAAAVPDNSFVYGDVSSRIESVVYTFDSDSGLYTFYFSPTRGLIDLNAMLLADDYIKIVTKIPSGEIDLNSGDVEIVYKNLEVTSDSGNSTRASSSLYVYLMSTTTVKMSVNVTSESGETLAGEYYGFCSVYSEQSGEQTLLLDKQIYTRYHGLVKKTGTNNYLLAVTNAEFTNSGTSVNLSTEGYALVLNFYGTAGSTWREMPFGTFRESAGSEDHTYYSDDSGVIYVNAAGEKTTMPLVGDVIILNDEQSGKVKIAATYLDTDYQERRVAYEGELRVSDGTNNVYMPQLYDDLTIEGFDCQAVYMGDTYGTGSGLMQIVIQDRKKMNYEVGGSGITLLLCGTKFNDTKNLHLEEGDYSCSDAFDFKTWLPGVEVTIMQGFTLPYGTYALYDDGSSTGLYAYGSSGQISIKKVGEEYNISFDLVSSTGFSIKGSYEGSVYIEDQSDDNDDDGSSTLEGDLELDLNYLDRAHCYPSDDHIYIGAWGFDDISKIYTLYPSAPARCSYQHIDIGLETGTYDKTDPDYGSVGKLIPGDIFRIDLLVEEGDNAKITPGVYEVSKDRYPASMQPGVCLRGFQTGSEGHIGTRWMDMGDTWGRGLPYGFVGDESTLEKSPDGEYRTNRASMLGYASLYTGTVTVEQAEGQPAHYFTFTIDGYDVLQHRISGTWTGPVYLGDSETPVYTSGKYLDGPTIPETTQSAARQMIERNMKAAEAFKAQYRAAGR